MATPGQLVQTMAGVLGLPAKTVSQYDRQLAEAGLRTIGGRGTSAAKVTATDAANLLIAILGSPVSGASISAAQKICEQLGSLPVRPYHSDVQEFGKFGFHSLAALPSTHTFRDALATLIEGASQGELLRKIDGDHGVEEGDYRFGVTVESPRLWAIISCVGSTTEQRGSLIYSLGEKDPEASELGKPDLEQERRISFLTLRVLGSSIATGRESA